MNAVGLLLTAELWKNIMREKQLKMVLYDHALNADTSSVGITKEISVQHAKRISTLKTKASCLGC